MKKLIPIFALTALLIFLLIFMPRLTSQQIKAEGSADFYYAPGKIVIQITKEVSPVIPLKVYGIIQTGIPEVDQLCQTFKVHTMRRQFPAPKYPTPDLTRHFVVRFDESMNLDEVVDAFSKIPFVEKVEKVGVHNYLSDPDDEHYDKQWYLNQTSDCDIDVPEAWDIQAGSDSVILAIADSGVAYSHSDLNDNIWINWTEYYGDIFVDDDGNDYIDDFWGWDFDDDDNTPSDYYSHGTHCSGIAAAETNNNNTGVAGIAGGWYPGQGGCRIMCLCIGHWHPDMSFAAEAICYATNMGATAINCSWESSNTGGLGDAVDYAVQNGVLIVGSAGNDNCDCPDYLGTREDCLDVGATDIEDKKASYSNYGAWVDVAAPGGEGTGIEAIYSTVPGGYDWMSRTSVAAPMVVGLAGLLKSEHPDWGRVKIWDAIVESADLIDVEEELGSGRINAHYALKQTWGLPATPDNLDAEAVAYNKINLSWQDNSNNENGFEIQRKKAGGTFSKIATVWRDITSYQDKTVEGETTYYYRVRAYNINGNSSFSNEASATTPPGLPPEAPSNLTTSPDCFKIKLSWEDNSTNEQGFKIVRKEPGGSYSQIAVVGENVTEYWNYGLSYLEFYYYKVRAYNADGNSNYSNEALGWTLPWKLCRGYSFSLTLTTDKKIINSGESVTYTYTVVNEGELDLTDVEITDERFGKIATNFTLIKGKARTFTRTVSLTETTTNLAEAKAIYYHEGKTVSVKAKASTTVEVRK